VTVRKHERPPIWRNVTVLKWIAQIVVLVIVLALLFILGREAARNFARSDISFGWGWLADNPGITIREGIDTNPDSGARALMVGMINTLRVAISGIVAATILGTIVGVARLSKNWIVNKLATVYIETIRNIPLLVQIFFWQATIIFLPALTEESVGDYWFKASNKGVGSFWIFPAVGFWEWLIFVVAGLIAARYVVKWRIRVMEETGQDAHAFSWAAGIFLVIATIGWWAHPVFGFLSSVWDGISSFIAGLPAVTMSIVIALAAIGGAAWWIRNFFESRRTPAGFGKLTDDDIFRVLFVGLMGIGIAVVAFVLGNAEVQTTTGEVATVAELLRDGIANAFTWFGTKFTGTAGAPLDPQLAAVEVRGTGGFVQYGTTGMIITPPFFAIWIGVTLYTAAFIAEIVRGGILAVSKGQTEAAMAVGLKRSQYLRLIILPQAFRIILPPLGNQYLNLFKNTSLGLAVAYADIVAVGNTLVNQTGQSLPIVIVWMVFFLTGSLIISAIVNYYNRKLKLVER
jgi:general L-amino acid transport system permease protein